MERDFFKKLQILGECNELPQHDYIFELADRTASILENENESFRPKAKNKKSGGLLDFTSQKQLPLIVVPDLHARACFLWHLLNWELPQDYFVQHLNVFQALEKGLIRIVLVGDLLHSEVRGRKRWMKAWDEFMLRIENGPCMTMEMKEGLGLLSMVMELKCAFPEHFHILKGNHENINNCHGHGDFPFCKFANEGEMVRLFMQTVYGDDVLFVIQCFERSLPVLASFPNCLVSHAEPKRAFCREEVIENASNEDVTAGLTWTENDSAEDGSVSEMLKAFTQSQNSKYLAGHRPVKGRYATRQNDLFIQIHNPDQENIALIAPDAIFNPDKDIHSVSKMNEK